MGFPLSIPDALRASVPRDTSVLVALSGGVDSGVALALLAELGCELRAVTFKNFCYGESPGLEQACCSAEAVADAERLARRFGARHWVTDVTDLFVAGAKLAVQRALADGCVMAVLTDGSPSCGTTYNYDGTFTGGTVAGMGVTAQQLSDQGLRVFPEDQLGEADRYLRSLEE